MDDERRNRTDLNWTIETEVSIAQGTTILCRNSNGDRGETQRIIWGEEGERIEEQREREKRTPYVQCRLLRAVYPYTGNWKGKHERRPRAVAKPYLPIHDDYTTNYELRFSPSLPIQVPALFLLYKRKIQEMPLEIFEASISVCKGVCSYMP